MSIKLPDHALEKARYLHTSNLSKLLSIGFIAYGFTGSEIALEVISATNKFLDRNGMVDFCLFAIEKDIPIVYPLFSKYSVMDISTYTGVTVALDLPSWQASLLAPSSKKYLYAYDMSRYLALKPNVIEEINKSRVHIISRTPAYKNLLKSLGLVNIVDECMEYFDSEKLIRIVMV